MCVYIDSRSVLANLLVMTQCVTLETLRQFRKGVKEKAPQTYIDISDDSILRAIENNPSMFSYKDGFVTRAEGFVSFLDDYFVDETINYRFPDKIKKVIKEVRTSIQ